MIDPNNNTSGVHGEDFQGGFLDEQQRLDIENSNRQMEYSFCSGDKYEREQSRHETLLFIEQNQPNDY